jgi:hypothetical protein
MHVHARVRVIVSVLLAAGLAAVAAPAVAQEMEPRAYAPSPVGMNFVTASVTQSSGGIAVDASQPLENVDATINVASAGYVHTFGLLGRAANFGIFVPYAWGTVTGDVFEERREVRRSGPADARLRLTVNLLGGPAQDRQQFAAGTRRTTLGASVTLATPTGEYDPDKLVNLGANRWAVKPEVGLYQPMGAWAFDLAVGAWFFTDNDDFYGGVRREQDPVISVQGHVSYTFRRSLWIAANLNYYAGGRSTVDGERKADLQKSSRVGLTASLPIAAGHSLKLSWSRGVTTRIGADFDTYGLMWQRAW